MCCSASTIAASERFYWPNNALAAVSLSYDDALPSQLEHAVPALDKHGFKGSFYLTLSSPAFKTRKQQWQTIAKHGHELGNHTINHACRKSLPSRDWVAPENDLDHISVAEIVAEINVANNILRLLDNQSNRTFTVPCTDNLANGKDYLKAINPLFIGIKSKVGTIANSMRDINIKDIAVISAENLNGEQLISLVKEARANCTMVNFTFHGIGGDHLSVTRQAHSTLLNFLAKNRADYWVDTFRNISLHISHHQE